MEYGNVKMISSKNHQQNAILIVYFFYINTVITVFFRETNGKKTRSFRRWASKASIFNRGVTANVQGPTDSKDVALGQRPADMFGGEVELLEIFDKYFKKDKLIYTSMYIYIYKFSFGWWGIWTAIPSI